MTIVEFLEARLAEDEAVASAAGDIGADWLYIGEGDPGFPTYEGVHRSNSRREKICHEGTAHENVYVTFNWHITCDCVSSEEGAHITRHDPARALREVAAKRAILAQSREADEYYAHMSESGGVTSMAVGDVDACTAALKALASAYDDHPDYQQEWAL